MLEHAAIWGSERSAPIEALWRKRILCAETDEVLAREILAAERFGQSGFVRALVMELYSNGDSLNIAYALSIIGYSMKCEDLIDIVEKLTNSGNLVGDSAKHAITRCHDAKYAKHWVEKMWDASTVEEFWCCLMIAQTCMDARVSREPKPKSNWVHYAGIFQKVRKAAISKKAKDRKKKLVGQEAPDKIFVTLQEHFPS